MGQRDTRSVSHNPMGPHFVIFESFNNSEFRSENCRQQVLVVFVINISSDMATGLKGPGQADKKLFASILMFNAQFCIRKNVFAETS